MKRRIGIWVAVLPCAVLGSMEHLPVLAYDPSMVAQSNDFGYAEGRKVFLERYRILTDLNQDGTNDLLLSEAEELFGNGGGDWSVYLNSNGYWRCIGHVGLPFAGGTFEAAGDCVNLWSYSHCSAHSGTFCYYQFVDGKLEPKGNNSIFVEAVADEYEDSVFARIDQAIFGHTNNHPFVVERSSTATNGLVCWKTVKDSTRPSRENELFDLRERLRQAERRAEEAERQVERLKRRVYELDLHIYEVCGVSPGMKWRGGAKSWRCPEEFSGFTNVTVTVDGNGFVDCIRLYRADGTGIRGTYVPTPEEQKVIHQVENRFGIRCIRAETPGAYFWGHGVCGVCFRILFVAPEVGKSFIELRYSRAPLD